MNKTLEQLYYDPSVGMLSANKFQKKLRDLGHDIDIKDIRSFINSQETAQVNRPRHISHDFPISSHAPAERLQADLLDLSPWSKWNSNYKYLLVVIDVYTKYLFVRPLKSKNESDISSAMKEIFDECLQTMGVYPTILQSDQESSIKSRQFKAYCKRIGVQQLFVEGDDQAVVVERANKTIRQILHKYFVAYNTKKYIDVLQDLVYNYNHTYHRSIKTTPIKAIANNDRYDEVMQEQRAIAQHEADTKGYSTFQVGDKVRLRIKRGLLEKKTDILWTKTVHTVVSVNRNIYMVSDRANPYKASELQLVRNVQTRHTDEDVRHQENEEAKEKKARRVSRRINKEGVDRENIEKDLEPKQLRKYRKTRDHGFFIQDD